MEFRFQIAIKSSEMINDFAFYRRRLRPSFWLFRVFQQFLFLPPISPFLEVLARRKKNSVGEWRFTIIYSCLNVLVSFIHSFDMPRNIEMIHDTLSNRYKTIHSCCLIRISCFVDIVVKLQYRVSDIAVMTFPFCFYSIQQTARCALQNKVSLSLSLHMLLIYASRINKGCMNE